MAGQAGAASRFPRFVASGDRALVVELADNIDDAVNRRVVALAANLAALPIDGVAEVVPTYRSLLVVYDPAVVRAACLTASLQARLDQVADAAPASRRIVVPVAYGGAVGRDLEDLAEMKGLSIEALIALHASGDYRVHMIGFAPGFAYLGGLPEALHTPRLGVPRQHIRAGAIGIGGRQASINSVAGPSGWRFVGRTALKLFDPARPEPFLLKAGDRVRFRPVGEDEAQALDAAAAEGRLAIEWERP